jgi:lipoprotein-releasing system permease protein
MAVMRIPYELRIGWRYTRSARTAARNGFISFISGVSMLGIALGVAALIIVLSVMNGFQKEVRDRMLSVLAHVEVFDGVDQGLTDVDALSAQLKTQPHVEATAPFVAAQGLIARGDTMRGVILRGIDPEAEAAVTPLVKELSPALRERLQAGEFGVILGGSLARSLGVTTGERVTLMVPSGQMTPAGVVPRVKQMVVLGLFDSGHYEFDAGYAYLNIVDAQRLFRLTGPTGIRLRLDDYNRARAVAVSVSSALGPNYWVSDWTRQNRNWFAAVQVEKRLMAIILTLIVAVAAFNLVSTLVMTVTDKRADIAILRTLGASPGSIMGIFVVQGATVGVLGTFGGLGLGLLVAFNIDVIVPFIENLMGARFLPQDIYLISQMPSDPQWGDIFPITVIALVLSFLATIYPSWRASQINPAEALRYE